MSLRPNKFERDVGRRVNGIARQYGQLVSSSAPVLHVHMGMIGPRDRGFYLWEPDKDQVRAMPRFSMMCLQFDVTTEAHSGRIEEWRPLPGYVYSERDRDELMETRVQLSLNSPAPWNRPPDFLGEGRQLYSARLFCRNSAPPIWRFQFSKTEGRVMYASNHLEATCEMLEDWRSYTLQPNYTPA